MVITDTTTGSIADFACEVEITEYRVVEIEWVKDIYPSKRTRERTDEQSLANVNNMMQMKIKHRCGSKSIPVRIYSSIRDLIWTCLVI
ncbi:hypothetical protein CsSME_00035314 [Camellia sinensis var. sinensis]